MKSKQTFFYSINEDFKSVCREVENSEPLVYFPIDSSEYDSAPRYVSMEEAGYTGDVSAGDWNLTQSFLAQNSQEPLSLRKIQQNDGRVRFDVYQVDNPLSVFVKPSGRYSKEDRTIIGGKIATISEMPESILLYKLFQKQIRKEFEKVGAFWVGKSALQHLKDGWRLTTSIDSPHLYDLVLD